MSETSKYYYVKKGRRYYPVDIFPGFPADGLWLVTSEGRSSTRILKISDLPQATDVDHLIDVGAVAMIVNQVISEIASSSRDSYSLNDIGMLFILRFSEYLEKQREPGTNDTRSF